jgi:acyl-CoA synthetase (AMP-forming)/AMP-acid ligase II
MTDWNFADLFELCAGIRGGDRTALVNGERQTSWADFDRRAAGIATSLLAAGLGHQAKVAQYLFNCNEYLESVFAATKVAMVPVNTNYRYEDRELLYLWDNADAEAVVFHGTFSDRVARLREALPGVKLWLWVDDGSGSRPDFAVDYEEAAESLPPGAPTRVEGSWGRSGDDLYMLYTGGTTGIPKGVMWRQDDLLGVLNQGSLLRLPLDDGLDATAEVVESMQTSPPVLLPACPLMHGTGAFTAFSGLSIGGTVVTMPGRRFDPAAVLDEIGRHRVNVLTIVGDAFAKPLLRELDASPSRYDLSSLLLVISSGVMWSEETKHGLLEHAPQLMLVDAFSSSEALGMGSSVSSAGAEAHTASFRIGDNAKVIDEDGAEIAPGSGVAGRLALGGRLPLGYYKDPDKTAKTFLVLDGVRYSVPGDYAMVEEDGTLRLLGRGSVVINTGGEKVFPEEVEEALKTHPAVFDAACVGVPDDRFGEVVTAVVELRPGLGASGDELADHVRSQLAAFKAPRHVVIVDTVGRSPSGKLDYASLKRLAAEQVLAAAES